MQQENAINTMNTCTEGISLAIYEEDLQKLRNELRNKENKFKKETALLEQKVGLLEIQVKECKEREGNLRKMNENLTAALGDVSNDSRKFTNASFKELQQTLDRNSKDFLENKLKNNEIVKALDQEIKQLQEALVAEKLHLKDLFIEKEQEKAWFEARIHDLEAEKSRLETVIKQIQIEQRKSFDNLAQGQISKASKHEETVQKLKELHEREIHTLQEKTNRQIEEIKGLYSEKDGQECEILRKELETTRAYVKKLEESERALKTLLHEYLHNFAIDSAETPLIQGIITPQLRNNGLDTSTEKSTLSQQKTSFNTTQTQELKAHEASVLRKTPSQREFSGKIAKTNEKIRAQVPKTSRNHENLPMKASEKAEKSQKFENFEKFEKFQAKTEKTGKFLAVQPQNNVATALLCENCNKSYSPSQFLEHLKGCPAPKPVSSRKTREVPFFPENSTVFGNKANRIHKNLNKKLSFHQVFPKKPAVCLEKAAGFPSKEPLFAQKRTKSMHFQSAQNLLDSTSNANLRNLLSNTSNTAAFSRKSATSSTNSGVLRVLDELSYEKRLIFERLKEVEGKLKSSEDQNVALFLEKQGMERDFEELLAQLQQAQVQLAMSREERQENEGCLKQEVKNLINKLLKAKKQLKNEEIRRERYELAESSLNTSENTENYQENVSGFLGFCEQNRRRFDENSREEECQGNYEEDEGEGEITSFSEEKDEGISYSALTINQQGFKKKR